MHNPYDQASDLMLVSHCVRGDSDAWECLVGRYEGRLLRFIQHLLKSKGGSPFWAEDILLNTWEYLVVNRFGRLRPFDPAKGTLMTFLRLAGRDQVNRHFHDQWIKRRLPLKKARVEKLQVTDLPVGLILEEYLAKLTPAQKAYFLENHWGNPNQQRSRPLTKANAAKMEQRLLAEWRRN
jgi:DNA-directed RNA polymerase specialized sigma24 family protein